MMDTRKWKDHVSVKLVVFFSNTTLLKIMVSYEFGIH